nr:hypothetical protein [Tanacetum cinerariifolium]
SHKENPKEITDDKDDDDDDDNDNDHTDRALIMIHKTGSSKRDHDDHPGYDVPIEGDKSVKRQKTSRGYKSGRGFSSKQLTKGSNITSSKQPQQQGYAWVEILEIDKDEVIPGDETPELLNEF